MEEVQLFVPMDRRRALGRPEPLPERASGVVLFADVSGFSSLSAALARDLGPQRGAESLTRQLDRVIGALVAAVHRFHGSVIGFSGDGITCWFDDADGECDAGARGTACALIMQDVVAGLPPIVTPSEHIALGIKVAVAAGPVRRLLIGDGNIQKLEVLAGDTLSRMAEAANSAERGQVVAAREILDRLAAASIAARSRPLPARPHLAVVEGLTTRVADCPWTELSALADGAVRPWVPAPVYDRIHLGQGEFLAELRQVVSMFVRFTGIDYDADERAAAKLDAYVRWVQSTIEHYGGHLLQLSVDDKGSHLYVVVGALQAHTDAAQRAVAAACRLRTLPDELGFIRDVQIGISRGRVYSGTYGGTQRRAYSVLGHEVNVAARLMELAAAGEIIISRQVADAAAAEFELDDRGEVTLKGMAQPFRAFAVLGSKDLSKASGQGAPIDSQLVGRDADLQSLAQAASRLRSGETAVVIIEGAAGIGKSRLVDEFVGRARAGGLRVYAGGADAIERSSAYHLWRGVLRDLFGIEAPGTETSMEAIQERLLAFGVDKAQLAPLIGPVLGVRLPDTPLTAEMTGKVRADNKNDLLVDILNAAARRAPSMIVLEDAHWMDSASSALLWRVAREVTPLLLVITARPLTAAPSDEYAALLQSPEVERLRLDSLSAAATETLLRRRLGVDAIPEPVFDLIYRKSEGHPFFSEVIAKALLEAGLIQVRGGACYLSPGARLDSFDAPDTIEGVITNRIDSLGSADQLTLKVASVIGRVFGFGMLRDIHPVEHDASALSGQLRHLTQIEMLLEAPDADLEYLFKHVITQEVAYGLLLYRQRRELHHGVARWYEEHAAGDLSVHYPRLAHHWSRAARDESIDPAALEKALDYLEKAGDQALNSYANEEAVRFFSEALELDAGRASTSDNGTQPPIATPVHDARAARWHHHLSLAYQGLGDLARCREHAQLGLSLLGAAIPAQPAQLVLGVLGQIARRVLTTFGRRAPKAPPLTGASHQALRQIADLYIPLARVCYHTNDALTSLYVNTNKLNLMERLGPSPELAESYGSIGVTLGVFQLHSRADAYVRRAVDVARGTANKRGLVTAQVISSVYLIGVGQWRRVREQLEEARAICEALGDHQQWGDCMAIMADAAFLEGDMPRALGLYDELLAGARRRNNHLQELWAIRGKATAALRDGGADEAVGLLEHAVVLLEDTTDQPTRIDMHGLLAAARLGRGDWEEAGRSARAAAAIIAKTSPPTAYPQYLGYAAVAETFIESLRQSRHGAADAGADDLPTQAKQALANLHTYRRIFAIGRPQAWRYQGLYDQLIGNGKKARRSWQKGLASADALGIPYERGMLHYLLARSLPENDPARARHLEQAKASFAPLASTRLTRMAEES